MGQFAYRSTDGPSALSSYFNELDHFGLLTPQEEREVIARCAAGDESAKEQLIVANLRLVIHVAKRFAHLVPLAQFNDLIQEGNIGLMEAVERVDANRENKFSTYAIWWIRCRILSMLSDNGRLIRIPKYISQQLRAIYQKEEELMQLYGRVPDREEVALALDIPKSRLREFEQIAQHESSLDEPIHHSVAEGDLLVGDTIEDPSAVFVEPYIERQSLHKVLRAAFSALSPREQRVVVLHYGLNGEDPIDLKQIGDNDGGISRERIRQIKERSLWKLRYHPAVRAFRLSMR